jgi:hypothetical protein
VERHTPKSASGRVLEVRFHFVVLLVCEVEQQGTASVALYVISLHNTLVSHHHADDLGGACGRSGTVQTWEKYQ